MKDTNTYAIIRFYSDENKKSRIMHRGLTLEGAQAHCRDPETRKEGVWFDGYQVEGV